MPLVIAQRFVTLTCLILTCGCGYRHTELFPTNVRTVAVPIFENRSFYQGIEFDLTEALVKQIELRTPYKVTSATNADTILQGVIVSVGQVRLSRNEIGAVPQELEMRIRIDFEWKDLRTGQSLRQREGFETVGWYIPSAPMSEPLTVGQHDAVKRMAGRLVSLMLADW